MKGGYHAFCGDCELKEKVQRKRCNECENEKVRSEFGFKGGGRRHAKCKTCMNKLSKQKKLKKKRCAEQLLASVSKRWCSYCEQKLHISNFKSYRADYYPFCKDCTPSEAEKEKICIRCEGKKTHDKFGLVGDRRTGICKKCLNNSAREKRFERRKEGTKYCSSCCNNVHVSKYGSAANRHDGLSVYCKECTDSKRADWRNTLVGHISAIFNDINQQSKQKSRKVLITRDDILDLYHKQNGLCALSGVRMTYIFEPRIKSERTTHLNLNHHNNLSVDRINPDDDYNLKNIQLVCNIANIMKQRLQQDEFLFWCKRIGESKQDENLEDASIDDQKILDSCIQRRLEHAKKTIRSIEIDKNTIRSLYRKQKGRCNLSGIAMTFNTSKDENRTGSHIKCVSMDRIDSTKDYIHNNIQLLCRIVNFMKGDISQDIFIEWCKKITRVQKGTNEIFINPEF